MFVGDVVVQVSNAGNNSVAINNDQFLATSFGTNLNGAFDIRGGSGSDSIAIGSTAFGFSGGPVQISGTASITGNAGNDSLILGTDDQTVEMCPQMVKEAAKHQVAMGVEFAQQRSRKRGDALRQRLDDVGELRPHSAKHSLVDDIQGQKAEAGGDVITETKAGLDQTATDLADALSKVN